MDHQVGDTFESIESAHEFVKLLSDVVAEARQDINTDVKREEAAAKATRRLDALRIALYSLEKLELHMNKSRLILNDLRTLRRLLFEERTASAPRAQRKSVPSAPAEKHVAPFRAGLPPQVGAAKSPQSVAAA